VSPFAVAAAMRTRERDARRHAKRVTLEAFPVDIPDDYDTLSVDPAKADDVDRLNALIRRRIDLT
jgi:hypothetical protein